MLTDSTPLGLLSTVPISKSLGPSMKVEGFACLGTLRVRNVRALISRIGFRGILYYNSSRVLGYIIL